MADRGDPNASPELSGDQEIIREAKDSLAQMALTWGRRAHLCSLEYWPPATDNLCLLIVKGDKYVRVAITDDDAIGKALKALHHA